MALRLEGEVTPTEYMGPKKGVPLPGPHWSPAQLGVPVPITVEKRQGVATVPRGQEDL